ncbi:hypothetical protein KSS87_008356, partial [Heliosperma pusillum]
METQMSGLPTDSNIPVELTTGHTPMTSCSSIEPTIELSLSSQLSTSVSSSDLVGASNIEHDFNHWRSVTSSNTEPISSGRISVPDTHVSYEKFDLHNEVEELRLELQTTIALYSSACEDLVHAKKKVKILSTECDEEAEKINAATEREEFLRKIAEVEKVKHLHVMKEVQAAKNMLAKESYERRVAEINARNESKERRRMVEELI